ncbi:MAG: hypothetical protein CVV30_10090 [Methanomicrobiales archaeon HGW-Methanomicrobiales-1]|jgi:hypothetical protein|nr:MAG: hypothetical protein CVV30_10090 [Methanomicrobiales archaeon HGW-Methanomicrobiales-1]
MKTIPLGVAGSGLLIVLLLIGGCTSTAPQAPLPTPAVVTTPLVTPVPPTPVPYPDALKLGQEASFGTGDKTGKATVYRTNVMQNYTWTSPSWNSPSEQAEAGSPLGTQRGYNTATPGPGNAFLFVFIKAASTGSNSVYAPSPKQFVVSINGQTYTYQSVASADVTISGIRQNQYDYLLGNGGTGGYILPGVSNAIDGYLIYEVPASVLAEKTYLLCNLDPETQAVWNLG